MSGYMSCASIYRLPCKASPLYTPVENRETGWWLASVVHYRQQTKFVRVMFSQVFVCPQGGGGVCIQRVCIWRGVQGRLLSGWGWVDPPPIGYYGIGSTSGRYASYWNAFLLIILMVRRRFYCCNPDLSSLLLAKEVAGM